MYIKGGCVLKIMPSLKWGWHPKIQIIWGTNYHEWLLAKTTENKTRPVRMSGDWSIEIEKR